MDGVLPYRHFLGGLSSALQEMIANMENMGFHHMEDGTPGWKLYQETVRWESHLAQRIVWHDEHKA